jgi:outer membrane protein TolC
LWADGAQKPKFTDFEHRPTANGSCAVDLEQVLRKMKIPLLVLYLLVPLFAKAATPLSQHLTLEECISIALTKHQSLQVSEAAILMAEAQYQQAMSAYWPQLSLDVDATRADQDRTISVQDEIVLTRELSSALSSIAARPIKSIPYVTLGKLVDRDLLTASINLTYPIFTGGKRAALVNQAKKAIEIAEQGRRKSKLAIIRDVKRFYYGAQFALQMEQLASNTLERFSVIDELTERLYQNDSLKVKKTDYLRTKTTTALTRAMLHEAQYARELAHQALANAMGLDWTNQLTLAADTQPLQLNEDLQTLVDNAHKFNPDIQQLSLAVFAVGEKINEARSGYYPVLGFHAAAHKIWSDFDTGLINSDNREGWTIGVKLKWNLFDGFNTSGKVDHAKASLRKLESQKVLLNQATALQIKQQFLRLKSASKQIKDHLNATDYASQNRKLHIRAYREELVDTKDVLESQVIEAYSQGLLYRSRHYLNMALISLEYLVGKNIQELD